MRRTLSLFTALLLTSVAAPAVAQVIPILGTTTTTPSAPPTTATTVAPTSTTAAVDTTVGTNPVDTTAEAPPGTPDLSSETAPTVVTPAPAGPPINVRPTTVSASGLRPAAVVGAFGIGVGGVIAVALLLVLLSTVARSQRLPGGSPMTARRRARLLAGLACLAIAAAVGLVGYLRLSLEIDVNRQIPYMASAGMALVLLSAVGAALLVGEQMRTDEQRIEELEAAVQQLAAMVAPTTEAPPRTRSRARKG